MEPTDCRKGTEQIKPDRKPPLPTFPDLAAFSMRDKFLKSIGFESYNDYLKSDLWNWIREQLNSAADRRFCICCDSTIGLQYHHRKYDPNVMVGNFPSDGIHGPVVNLCGRCHRLIHYRHFPDSPNEWVDDLDEVDRRLWILKRNIETRGATEIDT